MLAELESEADCRLSDKQAAEVERRLVLARDGAATLSLEEVAKRRRW